MDRAVEAAARRTRAYWLLARLFVEQPGEELLEQLYSALARIEPSPAQGSLTRLERAVHAALASPDALLALQVEYTRLLGSAGGSAQAPQPYESAAVDGRLFGESTERVSAAYASAGWNALEPDAGPPDHVGNELRFLSVLCYREMEALQRGDEESAAGAMRQQHQFLERHVLVWVPGLCERLAQATTHPFYLAVAHLTSDALRLEREDMALVHGTA